uniref:Nuclease associated modular domain-containing protein n=1 Tax=viral metagenome TaxID=1070528 RepID=A0A6M3IFE0_9ZZZZ
MQTKRIPWNKGLKIPYKPRPNRQGKSTWSKGKKFGPPSQETRDKISKANTGKKYPNRKKISEETRKKISLAQLKSWSNPDVKIKRLEAIFNGFFTRPTSLEKQMILIIEKYNLPYRYVGNGKIWIGNKNPDFINTAGKKILIEVGNVFHHQGNWAKERRVHFKKYGWKSYIFIGEPLIEEEVISALAIST